MVVMKQDRKVTNSPFKAPFQSRPGLADIAREAGVAISTVSAILNDKPHCYASEKTREQVLESARRLNYVPNLMVRGLKGQQTNMIGMVLPTLVSSGITMEKMDIVEQEAWRNGQSLIVAAHRDDIDKEDKCIRELLGYCVDGFILYPARESEGNRVRQLVESGFPVVAVDSHFDFPICNVTVDRKYGGYLQVKHLLKLGRKKLAFIIAGTAAKTVQDRLAGYRRALKEEGMTLDEQLVISREFGSEDRIACGMELAEEALRSGVEFDGLIASSDAVAVGAIGCLWRAGIRIPDDVSVIGFNDDRFAKALMVPLTTIRQPREVGKIALELLTKQIKNRQKENPEKQEYPNIVLKPKLIVRQSTEKKNRN